MRRIAVVITMVAFGSTAAFGLGIPAKLKSKKVQGDLVPAFNPVDSGPNTGYTENNSPAFLDDAEQTGNCTFTKGKFKLQVGKDASIKLIGVDCGAGPFTGSLCAHSKQMATIMDEEIDKSGNSTPVTCSSTGGDIEGQANFSTGNIGLITCDSGKCKGTLPVVVADPCPAVDKVSQVSRVEVFDGADFTTQSVLGTSLKACCGTGQSLVGGTPASNYAPCDTSTQEPFAEMGTITQGVTP